MNNLRQFGIASALYVADNKGHLNYQTTFGGNPWWYDRFEPYISSADVRNDQTIWLCPGITDRKPTGDENKRDYAMSSSAMLSDEGNGHGVGRLVSEFNVPARKVYIIDNKNNSSIIAYSEFYYSETASNAKIALRHSDKCNILFLDGHVAALGIPPCRPSGRQGSSG